jgi:hypothetical protein
MNVATWGSTTYQLIGRKSWSACLRINVKHFCGTDHHLSRNGSVI